MNKLKCAVSHRKSILIALLLSSTAMVQGAIGDNSTVDDRLVEDRIMTLSTVIDVRYNSEVRKRVRQYTINQRSMSETLIGRSKIYFPRFEEILAEKGMPLDLKYLSVVESGLTPAATSRSGAAGLWQFMKPTGRMMGLKISRTVDERRDIEKSTAAAAEYLLKLYGQFDDWTLAIAAYNCGPGNMRKAIRKSGGKRSFWEIKKYLPKETREYVPKFIAMTYVMNYYYEHDLMPTIPHEDLINTSTAKVFESINLDELSSELDIELATMRTLNPSFIRNYIPHSEDGRYILVLPTPDMRIVAKKYHVLATLPLLEERKEEAVPVRPTIQIAGVPSAISISSSESDRPAQVRSLYAHPVTMGGNKKGKESTERPDAYRLDIRKISISEMAKILMTKKTA